LGVVPVFSQKPLVRALEHPHFRGSSSVCPVPPVTCLLPRAHTSVIQKAAGEVSYRRSTHPRSGGMTDTVHPSPPVRFHRGGGVGVVGTSGCRAPRGNARRSASRGTRSDGPRRPTSQ